MHRKTREARRHGFMLVLMSALLAVSCKSHLHEVDKTSETDALEKPRQERDQPGYLQLQQPDRAGSRTLIT